MLYDRSLGLLHHSLQGWVQSGLLADRRWAQTQQSLKTISCPSRE